MQLLSLTTQDKLLPLTTHYDGFNKPPHTACTPAAYAPGWPGGIAARGDGVRAPIGQSSSLRGLELVPSK